MYISTGVTFLMIAFIAAWLLSRNDKQRMQRELKEERERVQQLSADFQQAVVRLTETAFNNDVDGHSVQINPDC